MRNTITNLDKSKRKNNNNEQITVHNCSVDFIQCHLK